MMKEEDKLVVDVFSSSSKHKYNNHVKSLNQIAPFKLPSYIQMTNARTMDVVEFIINLLKETQIILTTDNDCITSSTSDISQSSTLLDGEYEHDLNHKSLPHKVSWE